MNRRKFIKLFTFAAGIALLSLPKIIEMTHKEKKIKPAMLRKGDKLGLIAPGMFITQENLDDTIQKVKDLGFDYYYTDRILLKTGYLAGDDSNRVADIHEMYKNNEIAGIFCVRGGFGCTRILDKLDYNLIKKNPKPLIGFSDITALHLAIYKNTGMIGFHGPLGVAGVNDYTKKQFSAVLMNKTFPYIIENKPESDEEKPEFKPEVIFSGTATGELVGGNLSLLVSLIGTPFDPDYDNKLIFIEDIDEPPYKIDRMLTQMYESGKFSKAKGVILGVFRKCDADGEKVKPYNSFSLKDIIYDRFSTMKIPVLYGFSFGHIKNKCTLPIGINACLDTNNQTITLLENSVE